MRYWVYINGQVLERPFEQEEFSSIQGFTGETLICPEVVPAGAAQEWVAANVVFPPVQVAIPQPQPLPAYYQYPQQQAYVQPQQSVPPYQTTRMPIYAAQPQSAYNPYPAQQTQYNQPVYEQPVQAYDPAAQTQEFDTQDMFDASVPSEDTISSAPVSASTEAELLQKIDVLTREIQDVKQKLYSLSDNLQYSGVSSQAVSSLSHHTEKEPSSRAEKKEQPSSEEDEVALPAGYIDDIPEVVQEDTETSSDSAVPSDMDNQTENYIADSNDAGGDLKDMDSLLGGAAAVSPSEDFLQDAINTTFSNKHKKEVITDPNAIVDLAKKENTDSKINQQPGTVVTDGNALSEDDIPTIEEDFEDKLSFTQANLEKIQEEKDQEFDEFAEQQAPLPEDLSQHSAARGSNAGEVREITEELLSEPVSSQSLAEEGEFPVQQQEVEQDSISAEPQPFEIDASSEDKDNTKTATLEEVFNDQPQQTEQEEELPAQEEPVEEIAPEQQDLPAEDQQELPQEEEPLPSEEQQAETDGIPKEVPSAQNIGETEDDASFRENEPVQEQQEFVEQESQEQQEPAQEAQEEQQDAEVELPQEEDLTPLPDQEEDPMNIETSQSAEENDVLQEFAEDKKQLEENTKDMTSSAFDVISSPKEGSSALDELTGSGQPVVAPMPADGEDQFLKTFTSSIEEVFLDQPTSIISDYVPPAQASASAEDFDSMDVIASGTPDTQDKGKINLMDLKSAPQEDVDALKKVRRIKPAAIKTVPMVAANGGDITQGEGQPDIEEAIAELGGNSIIEKALKTFGTISGLLVILLLFIALLAVMHIIPVKLSPAHYLLSKVFKKPAAEATTGNNAVDASVAEALKEREAKIAAEKEIIVKVKNYKLGDGSSLEQKILSIHPKDAAQIEWTADQAVDPSYFSIAAKLPPNQEGYSLTYRFSYNTMDNTLVPTTSEANNIIQAAALAAVSQAPQQPAAVPPVNQIPSVRRIGTGLK